MDILDCLEGFLLRFTGPANPPPRDHCSVLYIGDDTMTMTDPTRRTAPHPRSTSVNLTSCVPYAIIILLMTSILYSILLSVIHNAIH